MQYVLTDEELKGLVPREELWNRAEAIETMRKMIVGNRCIHADGPRGERFMYCGECPLSDIGGHRNGEERPPHKLSKVMCDLFREYGQ